MILDDGLERIRQRFARDDGVSEIVAYIFMFALGAIALVFAMDVMVDTQETGSDVAHGTQINQIGQLTTSLVDQAARVGAQAPNATYNITFDIPDTIGNVGYNISFLVPGADEPPWSPPCPEEPSVRVLSDDGAVNETFLLGNLTTLEIRPKTCLTLTGEVHSSAAAARIKYEASPEPRIVLQPANQVT